MPNIKIKVTLMPSIVNDSMNFVFYGRMGASDSDCQ
jgi:hypothetical protein